LGFSVSFDPLRFRFAGAALADGLQGAAFNVNLNQEASGRVGLALALPAGKGLAKGNQEIVVLTLMAFSGSASISDSIEFGDQPFFREIVDVNAKAVTFANPLNESPLVPGENQARRRVGTAKAPGQEYSSRR